MTVYQIRKLAFFLFRIRVENKTQRYQQAFPFYHLVAPPFATMTASIRHGIEFTSCSQMAGVSNSHACLHTCHSCSSLVGLKCTSHRFWPRILHKFSNGLRSGDWGGQLRTSKFWPFNHVLVILAVCLGSLSCIKIA